MRRGVNRSQTCRLVNIRSILTSMGKTQADWHRIQNVDSVSRTGRCSQCGLTRVKPRYGRPGQGGWRCSRAFRAKPSEIAHRRRMRQQDHRRHVGARCECCGFIAEHLAQLDVDHRDGNHSNNDPSNLQTLCANCHRLKTLLERNRIGPRTPSWGPIIEKLRLQVMPYRR